MARSLEDCLSWSECDSTEACFMEEIFEYGLTTFNGGCRALDACQGPSSGQRRDVLEDGTKRDVNVRCRKCCNDDNYCNEKLCGIGRATNLTMCNQCDGAFNGNHHLPPQYPLDCAIRKTCQSNEMCFASTYTHGDNSLRHYTSCKKTAECLSIVRYQLQMASGSAVVGKRDRTICSTCCGDDMCNNDACDAIRGQLIHLQQAHSLNMTTLKEIV